MIQFRIGRTMLAAYYSDSKLLILSQNTVRVSAPCRFRRRGCPHPAVSEARVSHPSRFSKGATMAGAALSAPLGLWKLGLHHSVGLTWKSGPSRPRKPF